tara:strand:- start:2787 stop:3575 length:789 start_codon:yes stop_codon:yes gene_type:complete
MNRPSLIFACCISFGLHAVALSGANFLLPRSDSTLHGPVTIELLELSQPAPDSRDPIPAGAVVKAGLPFEKLPVRQHEVIDKKNAEMQKNRKVKVKTANATAPYQKPQVDAAKIAPSIKNPAANPVNIVANNDMPDDNKVHGDRVTTLPTDVHSLNLNKIPEIMGPDIQYLSSTPPLYPRLAQRRGWEGTVLLEVEILSSGNVNMIRVVRGSGHKVLDRAATRAVYEWQFSVRQTDDSNITATVEIPVTFILDTHANPKSRG